MSQELGNMGGGSQSGLGILNPANKKEWLKHMNARLGAGSCLEACRYSPVSKEAAEEQLEKMLATMSFEVSEEKLPKAGDVKTLAMAKIAEKKGFNIMVTCLGMANSGLGFASTTGTELYQELQRVFGLEAPENRRLYEKQFDNVSHVYKLNESTVVTMIRERRRVYDLMQATGSSTTEKQAFDKIINAISVLLHDERKKWQKKIDKMSQEATKMPPGSWELLIQAFQRAETMEHQKRLEEQKLERPANTGGKALVTGAGNTQNTGGCRLFKAGNCKFGDKCRFSHAGGGGGRGGRDNKQKVCYKFEETGKCSFGDRCKFSHAGGRAGGEQDEQDE
jgi:hypothetical protein